MKIYRPSRIELIMILVFLVVASNGGYHQFIKANMVESNECCETTCKDSKGVE